MPRNPRRKARGRRVTVVRRSSRPATMAASRAVSTSLHPTAPTSTAPVVSLPALAAGAITPATVAALLSMPPLTQGSPQADGDPAPSQLDSPGGTALQQLLEMVRAQVRAEMDSVASNVQQASSTSVPGGSQELPLPQSPISVPSEFACCLLISLSHATYGDIVACSVSIARGVAACSVSLSIGGLWHVGLDSSGIKLHAHAQRVVSVRVVHGSLGLSSSCP